MDRRKLLRSLAAGLTVTVAGCGGDSETPSESPSTEGTDPIETPEATPTATPEQTPTTTPRATSTQSKTPTQTPPPESTPTPEQPTAPESTPTPTPDQTPTPEPTPTPVAQSVDVGAGDGFSFAPESFTIEVGDTVEWVWVGSNHNVTADSVPAGSDWTGTPGAPDRLFDSGHTYRYTFEVPGEYSYYCVPHRSAGMVGSFTVIE
jgi:plastocyanin